MIKLNNILLIDDDYPTIYLHQLHIKSINAADNVVTVNDGLKALNLLKNQVDNKIFKPELILLDINMPVMNGWEFLEEFEKFDDKFKNEIIIIMVTTSVNPEEKIRASKYPRISGFVVKPISEDTIVQILNKHFK